MVEMITDVMIILTPVPMILRLHISPSQKLAILGIFALGVSTIVILIIRMVTMLTLDFATVI
ncbi:hypothetical protein BDV40DRAFT_296346 [Aspergillus tamarii]|uniref:Rhodopsin domain-containing protein n=1 Tax=Aspergillus tamarii TaxID=41984 RepID=A0A5N6V6D0_ASPTM|nr:hypothetical protein BDV40DRAFT_296346 [Aspergillus tamarii]